MAQPLSISCPISNDQLVQIDALIAQTGQTRSEWLQQLINAALSQVSTSQVSTDNGLSLSRNHHKVASPTAASTVHHGSGASPYPGIDPLIEDEEDEPDEVLHDFLAPEESSNQQYYGSPQTKSASSSKQPQSFSQNIYEAEDEPDEVLQDFL